MFWTSGRAVSTCRELARSLRLHDGRVRRAFACFALGGFILAALATGPARADLDQQKRQEMYYAVKPAVVLVNLIIQAEIQIQTEQGPLSLETQLGGSGSGWIISGDGYLVTNGHVVELYHAANEDQLRQQLLFKALSEQYFPVLEQQLGRQLTQEEMFQTFQELFQVAQIALKKDLDVYLQNGKGYPAEVKEYSPPLTNLPGKTSLPWETRVTGKDVAILKIEGQDLPTVRIGDSDQMQLGGTVYVAGYPGVVLGHAYLNPQSVLETSFTRGQVSSLKLDVKGSKVIQLDAAITWGNSGGPVFNDAGEVIGMATFISISEGQNPQAIQGFNFAVPSNVVREFVRAAGVVTEPSLFDVAWGHALDAYYSGKHDRAVQRFDEVVRLMPDLPDAMKLRREAIAAPRSSGMPGWLPLAIGAVAVIGVVLVTAGVVARRGKSKAPASTGAARASAGRDLGRLVVQSGPLAGNRFSIPSSGVRIGRDPDACQVVVAEETVSREQAIVLPGAAGNGVLIRNLSGTNPTFVNGRPIQEAGLKAGDQIKVGGTVLVYEGV